MNKKIEIAIVSGIEEFLGRCFDILEREKFLTVYDLFEGPFPYEYYDVVDLGWIDLTELKIKKENGFYIFSFPEPVVQDVPMFEID